MHNSNRLPVIVAELWQVDQALRDIGLDRHIIRSIAFAAASARADALPVDPCGAAGTFSYHYGVRTTRLQLLPRGWRMSREGNIEATVNDELGVQLCFQNVDVACTNKDPEAISGKGSASRDLIRAGMSDLFNPPPEETTPAVWFICVSVDDHGVHAEVSLPKVFDGNQFAGFIHRLWVIDESPTPEPTKRVDSDDSGDIELDVPVSKK